MKSMKVLITVGVALVLSACGSDSSKGGSDSNGYTGSKSDIQAAKKLVAEYDDNYGRVYFDKGYIDRSKVVGNINAAMTYLTYLADYNVQPNAFWAMRHVGCILSDGSTKFTEVDQHTQMDVLVGEKSARATFVQQNVIDRCYLGYIGLNGNFSVNGQIQSYVDRTRGILPISRNQCRDLKAASALVRIPKEEFDYEDSRGNPQPNYYYANYNRYRWTPDQDYYYEISGNRYLQFNYSTKEGSSEDDSFARTGNSEAVFVSKTVRVRSSGYGCVKDVYWGFEIDPSNPPGIQILGRNGQNL